MLGVCFGCGPRDDTTQATLPAKPPDIVLVSLDTLRRDHVGAYRPGEASFTPTLDDFAASAVVFENAYAQIPFTLPSHMSMFTGLYPDVHQVERKKARLVQGVPTLGESLSGNGYRTVGLVTNLWMKGAFGFARGFDHYERLPYGLVYARRVNDRLFELLDAEPEDPRPLFLFLHYIDPHSDFYKPRKNALPYYAPPEYLEGTGITALSREFCDRDGNCATDFLLAADQEDRSVPSGTIDRMLTLYARGVEHLDHELGALFTQLRGHGIWDDAYVVVTSDHGEEFREHGRFIHVQPYVENLAIPLMIKFPKDKNAGARISALVETVDFLPTLLEVAGARPPAHVQGESFLPLVTGSESPKTASLGRDKLDRDRYTLRTRQLTLVHNTREASSELYDLVHDPGELSDLSSEHPQELERLLQLLRVAIEDNEVLAEALDTAPLVDEEVLSDEERELLRAIGYLE
jgi:arylsulfatase A-like enzyme